MSSPPPISTPPRSKIAESRLARRSSSSSSGRKGLRRKSLSMSPPSSRRGSQFELSSGISIAPKLSQTSSHEAHRASKHFSNVTRSKSKDRMMHKVSNITKSRNMCVVDSDDNLSECVNKMTSSNSTIALVINSSKKNTFKMITRENVVKEIFTKKSLDVSDYKVWQVACKRSPIISSNETLAECAKRMKENKCDSLFVVDNDNEGAIVGFVDFDDLFQYAFATSAASIHKSLTSVDLHMERLHEETSGMRHVALSIVDHLITSLIILLLMIADLSFAVYAIARDEQIHDDNEGGNLQWMHITTLIILGIFVVEIMLRMYAYREEFLNLLDIFDAVVVILAFVFGWFDTGEFTGLVVILRLLRFMRAVRVVVLCRKRYELWSLGARKLVSQNKARIRVGNFDLDLSYVEPQIIAMSLPSTGAMKMYRNPIDQVAHYLDLKHEKSYHVYNMCSEADYPIHYFHNHVTRVPFDDHGPPTLEQMISFTNIAATYLRETKDGVVCVHCKGGKGRTGTMIAALLLRKGICDSPEEALNHFARKRTIADESTRTDSVGRISSFDDEDDDDDDDEEEKNDIESKSSFSPSSSKKRKKRRSLVKVEGPSQIRYVRYFSELLKSAQEENMEVLNVEDSTSSTPRKQSLRLMQTEENVTLEYPRVRRKLVKVQFEPAPKLSGKTLTLNVNMFRKSSKTPILKHVNVASVDSSSGIFEFPDTIVTDDVKFQLVYDHTKEIAHIPGLSTLTKTVISEKQLCFWHLHTSMLKEKENKHGVTIVELGKLEIDGAHKDRKCKTFQSNTKVLIHFGRCDDDDDAVSTKVGDDEQ